MKSEFPISVKTKNLFFSLAESIAQTLNVTSCYVCGGTNIGHPWPGEAKELDPWEPFNKTTFPKHRKDI
jgi:ABC-type transporter lipoprotein component MlaA